MTMTKKWFCCQTLGHRGPLREQGFGAGQDGEHLVARPLLLGSGWAQPLKTTWDPFSCVFAPCRRGQRGWVHCVTSLKQGWTHLYSGVVDGERRQAGDAILVAHRAQYLYIGIYPSEQEGSLPPPLGGRTDSDSSLCLWPQ